MVNGVTLTTKYIIEAVVFVKKGRKCKEAIKHIQKYLKKLIKQLLYILFLKGVPARENIPLLNIKFINITFIYQQ